MTKKAKEKAPLRLDLACGQNKAEGFWGVDYADAEGVDQVVDLEQFPWPWEDSTVEEIHSSHYVEHTPMYRPDGRDGLIAFMDECWRVLEPGGRLRLVHPYARSDRAFQDPTHRRFINTATWHYFSREWRESQRLDHYPIASDFEIVVMQGLMVPDHITTRNDEFQQFAQAHYWNTIGDLYVEMKARK